MKSPCYCITARSAARKITALYDETLASTGVNLAQFALLKTLEREGGIALTELGDLMELDRSTIGRNVRVIAKLGLVALGKGADQRETTVGLTEEGHRVCDVGTPLWDNAQARIEQKLGREKASELRVMLSAV
jgi:DNA-binding MarR family transcriptional regulator